MKIFNSLFLLIGLSTSVFAQSKPFKVEKDMKQIVPLYSSMDVEVGDKIYYSASVHGSVGIHARVWSRYDSIVQFMKSELVYDDEEAAGMSGGDAATRTFVFEALSIGKSTVVIHELFRGELTNEYEVEINVIEKKALEVKNVDKEKTKKPKKTVQLIPLKATETIEVGQKLEYVAHVHASVGKAAKVWEKNNGVLKLVDTQFKFKKKQVKGMTGGDAATRTFIFEGMEVGESSVTIQEIFRGEVQNEWTIIINVVEKS